jgi:hypothetical protein
MAIPLDQFQQAAEAVMALRSSHALRLLVQGHDPIGPPGAGVRFVVRKDDDRVTAYFADASIDYQAFREALPDIGETLTFVARSQSMDSFVAARTAESRADGGEDADIARQKYESIIQLFPIAELTKRFWLKRTTKTEVTKSVDWEVSSKLADDDLERPGSEPVPFATLRMETGGPSPNFIELMTGKGANALVLTLDVDDVDYLIDSLQRMRSALSQAGPTGDNHE